MTKWLQLEVFSEQYVTLPTKVRLVKAMVFPVVVYGCEIWIIKKAECWRIDALKKKKKKNWCFWTVVLKILYSPLESKEINQSILKEFSSEYSLEGLMLKLKLQYFGYLTRRNDSLEKTLMLGKTEGRRRGDDRGWDGWMASPTQWTWAGASSGSRWRTGKPGMLQSVGLQRVRHKWATKLIGGIKWELAS